MVKSLKLDVELMQNQIRLQHGAAIAQVAPRAGGCLSRYALVNEGQTIELMRPASEGAINNTDPQGMAAFPLFPYSGRIRDGRFEFRGAQVQETLNFAPSMHSIHGHAWQAPWDVISQEESSAVLRYEHSPGAWPFAYAATQRFNLTEDTLTVVLELQNRGTSAMPAGIGLHPYFTRTPRATVQADVAGVWLADEEVMPTEHTAVPADWPLATGLVASENVLDNIFTGWRRSAAITWPETNASVVMKTTAPLDFLVVYTPAGETFFCVEPVSHCADAFNLHNDDVKNTGIHVLEPDEELCATIHFHAGA